MWGFKIENCDTSEVFKTKYTRNSKRECMGVCMGSIAPTQNPDTISVKFSLFKTFPVPQFSLLNPQILGTYEL